MIARCMSRIDVQEKVLFNLSLQMVFMSTCLNSKYSFFSVEKYYKRFLLVHKELLAIITAFTTLERKFQHGVYSSKYLF